VQARQEPLDQPLRDDLQAAEAGTLEGIEQVEPGGAVGGGHSGGNVPGNDARSQRSLALYPWGDIERIRERMEMGRNCLCRKILWTD
jgi:hypothetical protein